jgi:flavin reductase (DIM6/NTAB) family NADH-FMN oxidoreductase RutF
MRAPFISGMQQVASSVAVLTTSGAAVRHGATMRAFLSVLAEPPRLLISLRSPSRITSAANANAAIYLERPLSGTRMWPNASPVSMMAR